MHLKRNLWITILIMMTTCSTLLASTSNEVKGFYLELGLPWGFRNTNDDLSNFRMGEKVQIENRTSSEYWDSNFNWEELKKGIFDSEIKLLYFPKTKTRNQLSPRLGIGAGIGWARFSTEGQYSATYIPWMESTQPTWFFHHNFEGHLTNFFVDMNICIQPTLFKDPSLRPSLYTYIGVSISSTELEHNQNMKFIDTCIINVLYYGQEVSNETTRKSRNTGTPPIPSYGSVGRGTPAC